MEDLPETITRQVQLGQIEFERRRLRRAVRVAKSVCAVAVRIEGPLGAIEVQLTEPLIEALAEGTQR